MNREAQIVPLFPPLIKKAAASYRDAENVFVQRERERES